MKKAGGIPDTKMLGGGLILLAGVLILLAGRFPLPLGLYTALQGPPMILSAIAAYCGITVALASIIDRIDGVDAVAAYHHVGRWFWWFGQLTALLACTLTLIGFFLPGLGNGVRWGAAVSTTFCSILLIAFLDQAKPATRQQLPCGKNTPANEMLKTCLALILMAVAGMLIYQRYADYRAREQGYAASDEAERRAAKPWIHEFDTLPGQLSVDELKSRVALGGHRLSCFSRAELEPQNRLQEDDTHDCWTNIGEAWGIPAHIVVFGFGQHGLRSQMLRFPHASWPLVEAYLERLGQRQAQTFGVDPSSRRPISGWRIDSGLVFSSAPPSGEEVVVLWNAKDELARLYCRDELSPKAAKKQYGYTVPVAALWPEINCRDFR